MGKTKLDDTELTPEVTEPPTKKAKQAEEDTAEETAETSGFTDITLTCKECQGEFIFTAGQQEFFAEKGLTNQPGKCKACKDSWKQGGATGGGGGGGCFNCGSEDHWSRECPSAPSGKGKGKGKGKGAAKGGSGCFKCGSEDHWSRDCSQEGSFVNPHAKCYNCGGEGHISRDCPKPQTKGKCYAFAKGQCDYGDSCRFEH